jgi:uncharacterized damage-inducible protein DinB
MSLPQLIENYLAGTKTLRNAVAGLTRKQLTERPVPGKWSTLEVVCHLADFEPIYADRMKRVIAEDNPVFLNADEQLFAKSLAYQNRDLEEEVAIIEFTRRQIGRILATLPESALSRSGIYRRDNTDEPRTLERLLTLITNHIPHHVKFIDEKRQALGLK